MNLLFTGVPSDPRDDDEAGSGSFEESAPSNQYLNKKDIWKILLGLLIFAAIFAPWIKRSFDDRLRYDCAQNFKAMSAALGSYMAENDDRFPPTYVPGDNLEPRVDDLGRPDTWASTLVNLAGFDPKRSFSCPAADKSEVMIAEGAEGVDLPMSYGMYAPFSAVSKYSADDVASSIVIAETSSGGANGTYDPHPMTATGGKVRDGFLIGWSSGDFIFPSSKAPPPPSVTRLAIPKTQAGLNSNLTQGRHDEYIHVMFADGHYRLMKVGQLVSSKYWMLPGH